MSGVRSHGIPSGFRSVSRPPRRSDQRRPWDARRPPKLPYGWFFFAEIPVTVENVPSVPSAKSEREQREAASILVVPSVPSVPSEKCNHVHRL